jgi:hypothetical protein
MGSLTGVSLGSKAKLHPGGFVDRSKFLLDSQAGQRPSGSSRDKDRLQVPWAEPHSAASLTRMSAGSKAEPRRPDYLGRNVGMFSNRIECTSAPWQDGPPTFQTELHSGRFQGRKCLKIPMKYHNSLQSCMQAETRGIS